jgi:predicted nucleic acid-binding protein
MRFLLDTNVINEVAKPRPNARGMSWLLAHEMASVIPNVAVAERY